MIDTVRVTLASHPLPRFRLNLRKSLRGGSQAGEGNVPTTWSGYTARGRQSAQGANQNSFRSEHLLELQYISMAVRELMSKICLSQVVTSSSTKWSLMSFLLVGRPSPFRGITHVHDSLARRKEMLLAAHQY